MSGLIPGTAWKRFTWMMKVAPSGRKSRVVKTLIDSAELVISRAKTYYLTGGALNVQTGRLRSSVSRSPVYLGGGVFSIDVGTNVWYGKRWEEGLKTSARVIFPKKAKALRMVIDGQVIFRKWARLDPRPRPWLSPAVEDMRPNIFKLFSRIGVNFS